MKKAFGMMLLAVGLIGSGTVFAQDTLIILFKDGRTQTINFSDVQRIDFNSSGFGSSGYSGYGTNIDGLWKTSQEDVRFWQNGSQITGSYNPGDHGEIIGEMRGNVFEGYWIEDQSDRRCSSPKNNRYYWGRATLVFNGNQFKGHWGYCEAQPDRVWTGSRK